MCISLNHDVPVNFGGTILFGSAYVNQHKQAEHKLGYRANFHADEGLFGRARGIAVDFGWDQPVSKNASDVAAQRTGNSMLFMVPAQPGTMTADSLISMKDYPTFWDNIKDAVTPPAPVSKGLFLGASRGISFGMDEAIVVADFDDIYSVVIAPKFSLIRDALLKVPANRRPEFNESVLETIAAWTKDWTFVFYCFDPTDSGKAGGAMMSYLPQREDLIYLPAMDDHTGNVPNLQAAVEVDHAIILTHHELESSKGHKVTFKEPAVQEVQGVRSDVIGTVVGPHTGVSQLAQGDFVFKAADVAKGVLLGKRELYPHAPKPSVRHGDTVLYTNDRDLTPQSSS